MVSAYCTYVHAGWGGMPGGCVRFTVDDAMDFPGKSQAGEASLSLVPFASLPLKGLWFDFPARREES